MKKTKISTLVPISSNLPNWSARKEWMRSCGMRSFASTTERRDKLQLSYSTDADGCSNLGVSSLQFSAFLFPSCSIYCIYFSFLSILQQLDCFRLLFHTIQTAELRGVMERTIPRVHQAYWDAPHRRFQRPKARGS